MSYLVLVLAFAQLWAVFNMRDPRASPWRNDIVRHPFIWAALVGCLVGCTRGLHGLLLLVVHVPAVAAILSLAPLDAASWAVVVGSSLVPLVLVQIGKELTARDWTPAGRLDRCRSGRQDGSESAGSTGSRREENVVKKVLIATDGSDHAKKAVAFGADLAAKYDAEVVLLHVLLRGELSENLRHMAEVEYQDAEGGRPLFQSIATIPEGRFPAVHLEPKAAQTPGSALRAVADQVLDEAERIAREHGASRIERQIEDGSVVKRVLDAAEEAGVDLIVTGARGLSDMKAMLVGSVSHKLSHLAPVTCITVR